MKEPPVIRPRSVPPTFWWAVPLVGALVLAAVPVGLAVGIWSCLRTSADTTALRQAAARASGVNWKRQIELSAGRVPIGLARLGLNLAPLDPTARHALEVVRSAEVAVFDAPARYRAMDRAAVLQQADATMKARDWDRMVGVIEEESVVAVYVPQSSSDRDDLRVCLLVLAEDKLVVAAGRIRLEPLLELTKRHLHRERAFAWKH